jgi:hypothetical protein
MGPWFFFKNKTLFFEKKTLFFEKKTSPKSAIGVAFSISPNIEMTTRSPLIAKKSKVGLLISAAERQGALDVEAAEAVEAVEAAPKLPILKGVPIDETDVPFQMPVSDVSDVGPIESPDKVPAATKFGLLRLWINGTDATKAAGHKQLRDSYHAGFTKGIHGVSAAATTFPVSDFEPAVVLSIIAEDGKTVRVNVTWGGESGSVVVATEDRNGPYLQFDTVLAAVATMIGVSVPQLLITMRVTGIQEDRRACNFLVKQGAMGKGLSNNPERRRTVTFKIEPPVRCDLCHAVADTYWHRKAPGSSIGVVVCKSKGSLCPKTTVVIEGKPYDLDKNTNLHGVFFCSY